MTGGELVILSIVYAIYLDRRTEKAVAQRSHRWARIITLGIGATLSFYWLVLGLWRIWA